MLPGNGEGRGRSARGRAGGLARFLYSHPPNSATSEASPPYTNGFQLSAVMAGEEEGAGGASPSRRQQPRSFFRVLFSPLSRRGRF